MLSSWRRLCPSVPLSRKWRYLLGSQYTGTTSLNNDKRNKTLMPAEPTEEGSQFRFPIWKSLGFTALCGAGLLYYFNIQKDELRRVMPKKEPAGVIGTPKLGGPLKLIDQDGKLFDSEVLNKHMLVYFGFTHCPDVCPEELDKMSSIIQLLERDKELKDKVIPVLVTVDPERDGPAELKAYLKDFHPSFVGLTGSPEEIKTAAKKYRVYYRPAQTGGAVPSNARDYLVDHSIFFFLIDPKGRYVTHFGRDAFPAKCADVIMDALNSWDGDDS